MSNLDTPENKAGRLSSLKYKDWPAATKRNGKTKKSG
jgi:hypothetical protein